jgi:hypothetical protein
MELPESLTVPDLLRHLIDLTHLVHIRLALTRSDEGGWLGRSLVVDVFPESWLADAANHGDDDMFAEYSPRVSLR